MHKYTAKLSLLLIILEASIYDEGVLSEGVLSGRNLCLDGVMYGGVLSEGLLSEGVLSYLHIYIVPSFKLNMLRCDKCIINNTCIQFYPSQQCLYYLSLVLP